MPPELPAELWVMIAEQLPSWYYCKLRMFATNHELPRLASLKHALPRAADEQISRWHNQDQTAASNPTNAQAREGSFVAHNTSQSWENSSLFLDLIDGPKHFTLRGKHMAYVAPYIGVDVWDLDRTACLSLIDINVRSTTPITLTEHYIAWGTGSMLYIHSLQDMPEVETQAVIMLPRAKQLLSNIINLSGTSRTLALLLSDKDSIWIYRYNPETGEESSFAIEKLRLHQPFYHLFMDDSAKIYLLTGYKHERPDANFRLSLESFNVHGEQVMTRHLVYEGHVSLDSIQLQTIATGITNRFVVSIGDYYDHHTLVLDLPVLHGSSSAMAYRVPDNCAVWKDMIHIPTAERYLSTPFDKDISKSTLLDVRGNGKLIVNESYMLRISKTSSLDTNDHPLAESLIETDRAPAGRVRIYNIGKHMSFTGLKTISEG